MKKECLQPNKSNVNRFKNQNISISLEMTLPMLLFTLIFLIWKKKSRPDFKFPAPSFIPIQSSYYLTKDMQPTWQIW